MRRYEGSHEPTEGGMCWHRWRNRQRVLVHCSWADGYHAARSSPAPAGLDEAWAEAEAALPEGGWITVGTVEPGLVTVEAFHWPDGGSNHSIARVFKRPMGDAVRELRDQLRARLPPPVDRDAPGEPA